VASRGSASTCPLPAHGVGDLTRAIRNPADRHMRCRVGIGIGIGGAFTDLVLDTGEHRITYKPTRCSRHRKRPNRAPLDGGLSRRHRNGHGKRGIAARSGVLCARRRAGHARRCLSARGSSPPFSTVDPAHDSHAVNAYKRLSPFGSASSLPSGSISPLFNGVVAYQHRPFSFFEPVLITVLPWPATIDH
jgi:hypothetical protein